ncbi:MAG: HTTM domain-containing protein [Anaerolineae bacterium]|nr:HTTM domain-containing protein [Anaerolineae bacterium]
MTHHFKRLFAPVDIAGLVYFRLLFGAIMLWEVWRFLGQGRIEDYYLRPVFQFKYYGFEWVQTPPGIGLYIHFIVLGVAAICIILGLWYRLSAAVFFVGFSYVYLLDQTYYLNHHYLVCLISFLMIFIPAHRAFSLDAWRKPSLRTDSIPAWSLWLLRGQIGLVYFFAGIAKLNGDWLAGQPMSMWLADRTDFPVIGHLFTESWMVLAFSYGGLLFDLSAFPLLLWRRTRWMGLGIGLAFHLTNYQLFNIGIFPWFMLAANLLFLDSDWPRRILHIVRLPPEAKTEQGNSPVGLSEHRQSMIMAALGIYFAVQIFLPLRHFLYPGDVNWTEQGHRFSWHMKLRDKESSVRFFITDPVTGTSWEAEPERYLTERQLDEMSSRPDMILQFAHYLAALMLEDDYERVEVRTLAVASLNGRKPQLLIDPQVDLAAQPRLLGISDWIMPLIEPLVR